MISRIFKGERRRPAGIFKEPWASCPPLLTPARHPRVLRAKSLAARVPVQNGYKPSPFFLSLDSYRLASCPDAARSADALKKDDLTANECE
jgi:hypothetical protein